MAIPYDGAVNITRRRERFIPMVKPGDDYYTIDSPKVKTLKPTKSPGKPFQMKVDTRFYGYR
ncbi:MAG: hypothetical protein JSV88_19170 [Candidatus Aminicenantes bacterium]|nr:MAG: hypothetical protein JSV88_19170 [Candidatus Aminicenantes bacterium]